MDVSKVDHDGMSCVGQAVMAYVQARLYLEKVTALVKIRTRLATPFTHRVALFKAPLSIGLYVHMYILSQQRTLAESV